MYISVLILYFIIILYRANSILTDDQRREFIDMILLKTLDDATLTLANCTDQYLIYIGKSINILLVSFILIILILFIYL